MFYFFSSHCNVLFHGCVIYWHTSSSQDWGDYSSPLRLIPDTSALKLGQLARTEETERELLFVFHFPSHSKHTKHVVLVVFTAFLFFKDDFSWHSCWVLTYIFCIKSDFDPQVGQSSFANFNCSLQNFHRYNFALIHLSFESSVYWLNYGILPLLTVIW